MLKERLNPLSEISVKKDIICGKNAVVEALKTGRGINKIVVALGNVGGGAKEVMNLAKEKGVMLDRMPRERMDKLAKHHQGIVAFVTPVPYATVEDILERAKAKGEPPFLLLLDEITDPRNLGAIIRSAEAFGAHGILIPKRRSVPLNETVAKTSAGAIEYVPVARIGNSVQTLEKLKKDGFWAVGADMTGDAVEKIDFSLPTVLVIGSEGKGISRLLKEKLDYAVQIPMMGEINSLNASVAAAILMYEVMKRRKLNG
ncbi:MAG: 23S rRNA (guanosine(2251)-2'-O)-methyltransferase RlmB [Selenomonadaceae bacterium]|nr:23S rRNA (guanosine(2251)-2'-O)-methyltransferase RlmB [Selenomonadaceae bacterium]